MVKREKSEVERRGRRRGKGDKMDEEEQRKTGRG